MQHEVVASLKQEICEKILKRFDWYIVTQVHHLRRNYHVVTHPSVLDLEIDELVQRVRIKFWQALERRDIRYPNAYIKLIIQSELVDMARRRKHLMSLPTDEERIYCEVEVSIDKSMPDPADEVEQKVEASVCLQETIQAVLALPPRQRYAMICALRDHVDDLVQLVEAFKVYSIDIEAIRWPIDKAEKHVLQASLAPARRTLAKKMKNRSA